jgi:Flp pilus assembly protein TadG
MGRLTRKVTADRGAAALEFALVVPVLAALVFGMIDYGLFFTDSLGARDGARVAARQGSVEDFTGDCPDGYVGSGSARLSRLACSAVAQTGAIGGDTFVKITAPEGWDAGKNATVCVAVVEDGLTGFTPMPNDATVRARLQVRIEHVATPTHSLETGGAMRASAAEPASLWDDWCD